MAGHRRRWFVLVLAVVVVVAAAGVVLARWRGSHPSYAHQVATEDYLPGVAADVFLPVGATRAPVVVLIPGGGWESAHRSGLGGLAETLAERGIVAINATYRVGSDDARFPVPVADVVCAIDFGAARARRAGIVPSRVVVLGHSAGGQLAALAALAPSHFRRGCPYPPVAADALIGLAGAYDVTALNDLAIHLFGVTQQADPAMWRDGNPKTWASARPSLPILLAHGSADDTLSEWFSSSFANVLQQAGHPVKLTIVAGATHSSIYSARVIAATVVDWIGSLVTL